MKDKNILTIVGSVLSIISTVIVIFNSIAPNTSKEIKNTFFLLAILLALLALTAIIIERIPFFKSGQRRSSGLLIGICGILTFTIFIVSGKALWDEWHHQDQLIAVSTHDQEGIEIEAYGKKSFLNCLSTNPQFEYEVKTSSDEDVNVKAEIQMTDFAQFSKDNISKYNSEDISLNVLLSHEEPEDKEKSKDESFIIQLNGNLDHNGCAAEITNQRIEKKSYIIVDFTPTVKESGKYTIQLVVTYYDNENKKQQVESEELTFYYLYNSLEEIMSDKIAKMQAGEQTQLEAEAQTYFESGKEYFRSGQYDNALASFQESLRIRRDVLREENKDTADSYFWVGQLYYEKENYEDALMNYQESLRIRRDVLREENKDTADSCFWIGQAYYRLGKRGHDNALASFQESLRIRRDVLREENKDTAVSYFWVGQLYYEKENYEDALKYYQESLRIRRDVLREENKYTADSYYWIGLAYIRLGNYTNALASFQESLRIHRDVLREENKDTADSYYWIGISYYKLEEYENALENFENAYNLRKSIFGEDHTDTQSSKKWIEATRIKGSNE